jgi:hypothetical protein
MTLPAGGKRTDECIEEFLVSIEIANGVAGDIRSFAGRILCRACNLIDHASASQIIVTGDAADAFLHFSQQIFPRPCGALLASPQVDSVRGTIDLVVLGGVPGGTAI